MHRRCFLQAIAATLPPRLLAQLVVRPRATTFYGFPLAPDLDRLEADVAFLGIPYDLGHSSRPGARQGPAALRDASVRGLGFQSTPGPSAGMYDLEREQWILKGLRLADAGDVYIAPAQVTENLDRITEAVRKILDRGAFPAVVGGDHSITFPVLRAFSRSRHKIHIIHFDSHLDFNPIGTPPVYEHANHLRHSIDLAWIGGVTSIGVRGVRRFTVSVEDVRKRGVQLIPAAKAIQMGAATVAAAIPDSPAYYVTFDVDVLDPVAAPGTGTPVPGGLSYYQARDLLAEVARRGPIAGADFCELSPPHDNGAITASLASRLLLDFLGAVFRAR
ncbi:MAG: arginase family protein [Bryobacteraceae bacterium]